MTNHIKNTELQAEFYRKVVKERFPEVSEEHSRQMTSAVYRKIADQIRDANFPKARVKYLGIFQAYIKRASYYLKQLKGSLKNNVIEPELYFRYREKTVAYIHKALEERAKVLKEEVPTELLEVLLHQKEPEEGRTKFFYRYKQWLK